MRSREGGMQRGDRPGEGDAELLELPDVNTCRLVQSGLVSCVNTSTQHFNPATAVCMQRAHWVARAACVVGADTAHTESFRLWRNNRIAPLIRLGVRGLFQRNSSRPKRPAHPNLWGARGRCDVPGCGACERPIRTAIRLGGIHLREKQLSCATPIRCHYDVTLGRSDRSAVIAHHNSLLRENHKPLNFVER